MSTFFPITDSDLARARLDPIFRQRLLTHSLDVLLAGMKKVRGVTPAAACGDAKQLREGAELAVRLAELIQNAGSRRTNC
jgi:hypothetical protein